MKEKELDSFVLSWKFVVCLLMAQFLLIPVVTRGFSWEDSGVVIGYTLSHAFFQQMYSCSWVFQVVALVVLLLLSFKRNKWSTQLFLYYGGLVNALYAIIQNVAISDKYGLSIVTVNLVMMLFVSWMWFRAALSNKYALTFDNLSWRTTWMIPVAMFCFWWPMDIHTALPNADWKLLFTGTSGMAFCSMTPVFLVIFMLNKQCDIVLLRALAWVGFIIGIYNMANFASSYGVYLGIYHLPLLLISLYALLFGRKRKKLICLEN